MQNELGIKRGYLEDDFKFFHLKDRNNIQFEHHYHDFNKIIIFINGNVIYNIEGKNYRLKLWDVLFVPANQVHKPIIAPDNEYERIVIWINNKFLEEHGTPKNDLLTCFNMAREKRHLVRLGPNSLNNIKSILGNLEKELKNVTFGSGILANALFVQFMVYINRLYLKPDKQVEDIEVEFDEQIQKVIHFINENLSDDLSIAALSERFYINKYYLMHKFKANTGYSIHSYVNNKRLQKSADLIKSGKSPSYAAGECGFNDYSSFLRSFSKMYGMSPRKYYKSTLEHPVNSFQVEG
ncbi:AraC family transcriptional regulator [Ruminiclostridium cellulolyticum]|uniref:Transcriptional regulator, AraC family n=1 Tax=Ruminiclostridium cellulolyticum (strain ATCC 35319 / DSM 5812 / JCM 6584 / H10) TaxID=394503 RepID=B8I029_RUMCH|nr:AraC family transcriptional regulator [Ruminiclostridium cellulolyticum]ACL75529.1 transcriptional regulator, AraC family [Ruminiclostridium cellulolyticum H10]